MTPEEFIAKWRGSELTERAAAQSHFIDLCSVLGVPQPTPARRRIAAGEVSPTRGGATDIFEEEALARVFALNFERAAAGR